MSEPGVLPTPSPTPTGAPLRSNASLVLTGAQGATIALPFGSVPSGEYAATVPGVPRGYVPPVQPAGGYVPLGAVLVDSATLWVGAAPVDLPGGAALVSDPTSTGGAYGVAVFDVNVASAPVRVLDLFGYLAGANIQYITPVPPAPPPSTTLQPGHPYVVSLYRGSLTSSPF